MGLLVFLSPIVVLAVYFGMKNPVIWTLTAVIAIAAGTGVLVAGISVAKLTRGPLPDFMVENLAMYIGLGAGMTVGGIALLLVSLMRRSKGAVTTAN